jgi:hypothetical protein
VKPRRDRRGAGHASPRAPLTVGPLRQPAKQASPDYKNRFKGKCFRCLAFDHLLAHCWEPIRCLNCLGNGHIAKLCRARRRSIRSHLSFHKPTSRTQQLLLPLLLPTSRLHQKTWRPATFRASRPSARLMTRWLLLLVERSPRRSTGCRPRQWCCPAATGRRRFGQQM